jgi:hypothetical protein
MADLFASLQSTVAGILSYETHACRDVFEGGVSGHGRPVISIDTVPEELVGCGAYPVAAIPAPRSM